MLLKSLTPFLSACFGANMVLFFFFLQKSTESDDDITIPVYLTRATICWEPMVEP